MKLSHLATAATIATTACAPTQSAPESAHNQQTAYSNMRINPSMEGVTKGTDGTYEVVACWQGLSEVVRRNFARIKAQEELAKVCSTTGNAVKATVAGYEFLDGSDNGVTPLGTYCEKAQAQVFCD